MSSPGWVRLVASDDVAPGSVVEASHGDRDLVVWRGEDGGACVMEARCPHQWSHLAAEGAVDGNEIVCCTHYWRFSRNGTGWKENLSGRRDAKSDIEVFACAERDGAVWARFPEPT